MLQVVFFGVAILLGQAGNAMDNPSIEMALELYCTTYYEPNVEKDNYRELFNAMIGSLKLQLDEQDLATDVDYGSEDFPGLASLTLSVDQGGQFLMSIHSSSEEYKARLAVRQGEGDGIVGDNNIEAPVEDQDMAMLDCAYFDGAYKAMQKVKDEVQKQHFPAKVFITTGYRYEREGCPVLRRKDGIICLRAPKIQLTYRFMIQ